MRDGHIPEEAKEIPSTRTAICQLPFTVECFRVFTMMRHPDADLAVRVDAGVAADNKHKSQENDA